VIFLVISCDLVVRSLSQPKSGPRNNTKEAKQHETDALIHDY
jgi:hypothetical protein